MKSSYVSKQPGHRPADAAATSPLLVSDPPAAPAQPCAAIVAFFCGLAALHDGARPSASFGWTTPRCSTSEPDAVLFVRQLGAAGTTGWGLCGCVTTVRRTAPPARLSRSRTALRRRTMIHVSVDRASAFKGDDEVLHPSQCPILQPHLPHRGRQAICLHLSLLLRLRSPDHTTRQPADDYYTATARLSTSAKHIFRACIQVYPVRPRPEPLAVVTPHRPRRGPTKPGKAQ